MFKGPTPPTGRVRPLNPWDQEEERLGLAPPDPAPTIRKPFKPLNERLLDARKAREAALAQQPGTQPQSLGQFPPQEQPGTTRRPRLSLPQPHPTEPSAPPRPAAPKTQAGLVADPEAEGFDFPLITRAVQALTHALGHRPKPGETIPQEAVEPYLKALAGDRFDRRADPDFFRHVEGVYRAAFPHTYIDASGRMIDTPAQPIAFTPYGPAVPRQAQPGVVKAAAPAEPEAEEPQREKSDGRDPGIVLARTGSGDPTSWREAFEDAGRTIGEALGVEQTKPDQNPKDNVAPKEPEFDWKAHWVSDHDGWRGTVRGMAEKSGIDPDLFEDAPPEAEVAFAGAVAYRHMDPDQQRAVLQMVTELEQGDHKRLAQRLRGYIAEQHSLSGMHQPETLSRKEIAEKLQKNSGIRHISQESQRFLDDPLLVVPGKLGPHYLVVRGLAELIETQGNLTEGALNTELHRRQK